MPFGPPLPCGCNLVSRGVVWVARDAYCAVSAETKLTDKTEMNRNLLFSLFRISIFNIIISLDASRETLFSYKLAIFVRQNRWMRQIYAILTRHNGFWCSGRPTRHKTHVSFLKLSVHENRYFMKGPPFAFRPS